jgi:hypothetical protein
MTEISHLPSPISPKVISKMKGTFTGHSGRKVMLPSPGPTPEKKVDVVDVIHVQSNHKKNKENKERINKELESKNVRVERLGENTDVDDLERLLDNDAVALLNMKRDIVENHKTEIFKFREVLSLVKREYDLMKIGNDVKEKGLLEYAGKIKMLTGVSDADGSCSVIAQDEKQALQNALVVSLDDLAAEQRSFKMLSLMTYRLDEETNACRSEASVVLLGLDQAKFDYTNADSILRLNKNELAEQEVIMDGLLSTVKSRRDQRAG